MSSEIRSRIVKDNEPFFRSEEPYLRRIYKHPHPDAIWVNGRDRWIESWEVYRERLKELRSPWPLRKKDLIDNILPIGRV